MHIGSTNWVKTVLLPLILMLVKSFRLEHSNYRLITAYSLLRVNLDKIMHVRWDFDASSAQTRRMNALDKHQKLSACVLFCLNSRAQSKYTVIYLTHTGHKRTYYFFIRFDKTFYKNFKKFLDITHEMKLQKK